MDNQTVVVLLVLVVALALLWVTVTRKGRGAEADAQGERDEDATDAPSMSEVPEADVRAKVKTVEGGGMWEKWPSLPPSAREVPVRIKGSPPPATKADEKEKDPKA